MKPPSALTAANMSQLDDLLRPTPKRTKRQKHARILTVDIERRMGVARFFDLRNPYTNPRDVNTWPSNLCVAWKWLDRPDAEFASVWDDGPEIMARRVWEQYDRADVIITYNGVRFDNPHLRGDWFVRGFAMPSPWKDVDLYREVRRQFGFESKSLDQVCKRLGFAGKSGAYSADDADAAAEGDKDAQRRLRAYNAADVRITEQLYLRMLGWMPTHPIIGDGDEPVCCQCGSTDLKRNGWTRAVVFDYRLFRCRNCGSNVRNNASKRVATTRSAR